MELRASPLPPSRYISSNRAAPILAVLILAALLFFAASNATPVGAQAATDRAALVALYNATDGPNWTNNTNWLSDRPIGEWHGVTTDGDGRVTILRLGGNELSGPLPPELGSLTHLKELRLGNDNDLTGEILSELSRLTRLEVLDLGGSEMSGAIPAWLGDLSSLRGLYLDGNKFTGGIPAELGNLTNLGVLALDRKMFALGRHITDEMLAGLTVPE